MHARIYSEGATTANETAASPPRGRPAYFVQSPPNADVDKLSTGSAFSPIESPVRAQNRHVSEGFYNHSHDSLSTSRFSEPLKNQNTGPYVGYSSLGVKQGRLIGDDEDYDDDQMDGPHERRERKVRFYMCLVLAFALAFTLFCLILWGTSKAFTPKITLKEIVFQSVNVHSGSDDSGVPTDMLDLNSTVRVLYRNPATFFAVHVTSTPLQLSISQLTLASGQIEKFSQPRKSQRIFETNIHGDQVPLYGSVPVLYSLRTHPKRVSVPLSLTFTIRSRAYILGSLVKSTFYSRITCTVTLMGNSLGQKVDLSSSCSYSH